MNPKKIKIKRFTSVQRIFHGILVLTFLVQAATGLARMYIETDWGGSLAWVFGGYRACGTVHKVVGILMLVGFSVHVCYLAAGINWRRFPSGLLEPDSILLHPRDLKHFFQHIGWFLRINAAPRFERWGYWEKFDYWAVFWGIPVLGITGLLLAYPMASSRLIPGWGLNIAFWIHRIEAILAMAHVFIIHFFIGHLRRHNFPMDMAMFEGAVDLEKTREEKPAWIERLQKTGKLNQLLVSENKKRIRILFYTIGYAAVAIGVFLLIGGIINSPYITW